jgi:hypothetical protein
LKSFKYILIALLALSCSKEEESEETLASEPSIGFIDITPTEVDNFKNSVTLTISYSDNNGDVGFEDPDQYALWVKDSRLDSADWYHVPPLAPLGSNIIIRGELKIVLNSLFIIGNGNTEQLRLDVKLRDRANNWSNIINTPNITISR